MMMIIHTSFSFLGMGRSICLHGQYSIRPLKNQDTINLIIQEVHESGLGDADVFSDMDTANLTAVDEGVGSVTSDSQHLCQLRNGQNEGKIVGVKTVRIHGNFLLSFDIKDF